MSEPVCPKCHETRCSRRRRADPFEFLLSLFGFYPWECGGCGKTFIRKKRGKKKIRLEKLKIPETPLPSTPLTTSASLNPEELDTPAQTQQTATHPTQAESASL